MRCIEFRCFRLDSQGARSAPPDAVVRQDLLQALALKDAKAARTLKLHEQVGGTR